MTDPIAACLDAYGRSEVPPRATERAAVKAIARDLVAKAPGNSVEVRIPPYLAVQVVAGTRHRRGTPPATVECGAQTFIELGVGALSWDEAASDGRLVASGERSNLSALLPVVDSRNLPG